MSDRIFYNSIEVPHFRVTLNTTFGGSVATFLWHLEKSSKKWLVGPVGLNEYCTEPQCFGILKIYTFCVQCFPILRCIKIFLCGTYPVASFGFRFGGVNSSSTFWKHLFLNILQKSIRMKHIINYAYLHIFQEFHRFISNTCQCLCCFHWMILFKLKFVKLIIDNSTIF